MSWRLGALIPLAVSGFALIPGLALPFIVALALPASMADSLLLAYSAALVVVNIVANTVEQNTVGEYGRLLGSRQTASHLVWRRYVFRALRFAILLTVTGLPLLVVLYGGLSGDFIQLSLAAAPLLAMPILATLGSCYSGRLVARGHVLAVVSSQSMRSLFPIVGVLFGVQTLSAISALVVLGELVRVALLIGLEKRADSKVFHGVSNDELPFKGIVWQAGSMATSQSGSIIDRGFLAVSPVGSVATYEMAEKVAAAGMQLVNTGVLLRKVGGWARELTASPTTAGRKVRADLLLVSASAGVISAVIMLTLVVVVNVIPLNEVVRLGLLWAVLAVASVPASIAIMAANRVIVMVRSQQTLLPLVVTGLASNLLLNLAFFWWLGAFGILVSTVASRYLLAGAYVFISMRKLVNFTKGAGDA